MDTFFPSGNQEKALGNIKMNGRNVGPIIKLVVINIWKIIFLSVLSFMASFVLSSSAEVSDLASSDINFDITSIKIKLLCLKKVLA